MATQIDLAPFSSSPRFDGPSGVLLARRLIKAARSSPSDLARKALRAMRADAVALQGVLKERDFQSPAKIRPFGQEHTQKWSALAGRLESAGKLSVDDEPRAERARELSAMLFPDGLSFVNATIDVAFFEGEQRLAKIDDLGLERDVDAIAGAPYLVAVRRAHAQLGDVIGLGRSERATPSTTGLQDAIARLMRSVAAYSRVLAAEVELDDEESVADFRRAVAPLEAFRAATRGNGAPLPSEPTPAPAPSEEPDAPLPAA